MTEAQQLQVADLRVKRAKREVLHGISFGVPAGQIVGLLGPSGCGKTTVMRSIVGVQRISSGSITVLGLPAGTASLRRKVAYVTQQASVYEDLTVGQNIDYFRRILGAPSTDKNRVLTTVDIDDYSNVLVSALSGGQRNRVSLAIALLGDPRVLILDEPTVGLDPILRRDLWRVFRTLADRGAAIVVSSHVMDEASRCDRLLLMREGSILADDTPAGLLAKTGTGSTEEAFLSLIDSTDR